MVSKVIVEKNAYYDSVTLMSLSSHIKKQEGVEQAVVSMATQMNKELLENIELLTNEAKDASENDLIIAVEVDSENRLEEILSSIKEHLNSKKVSKKKDGTTIVKTVKAALNAMNDANVAVISVRGDYAAREAYKSLKNGMHVMIFSDNVTIEDERKLKELGRESGLLVMGPDCGTSIINQVGLCFSNKVKKGDIGLVAASGTGLQEVTVQLDRLGYGISQAIGVGGRDLHEDIGGIMMLESLKALSSDEQTKVIVLISKPPAHIVQEKILKQISVITKPVVVCFLDGDEEEVTRSGAVFAPTLNQAAITAINLLNPTADLGKKHNDNSVEWVSKQKSKLADSQKYVRGLFCGGTLTSEALTILRPSADGIKSNVAKKEHEKLKDVFKSTGHVLLDMGDDNFTFGKPHPMIEPSLRNERILQEARDPETAILLLDFELGFGSHDDPVGVTYDALVEAKKIAENNGRYLPIIAYICGTYSDKQNYYEQAQKLKELNIFIADSNEQAAQIAAEFIN